MEGEKKQRKGVQGVVEKVKGEVVPFSFPKRGHTGEELRASALELLQDHLLDDNNQSVCQRHFITFYPSSLLHGTRRERFGGDKGGSCMKVQAQLCNVPIPNSPKNTPVFTAFEAITNPLSVKGPGDPEVQYPIKMSFMYVHTYILTVGRE